MSHLTPFLQHSRPDLTKISRQMWFDNSTIETAFDCNRLAWYNYHFGFESKSAAMSAGSVWHAGIAKYHETKDQSEANVVLAREYEKHKAILQMGANRYGFGIINEALNEYVTKYSTDQVTYHEQEFHFAIWMGTCPEGTCIASCNSCFWLVGRFDGIITYMGEVLLLENKTTSQMGGSYLTGLNMSRQATTYIYGINRILKANGYGGPRIKGILYNVVKLGTSKIEFLRHTVLRHEKHEREFEIETIEAVKNVRASWNATIKPLKNTRHCNSYGECQFVDLCNAWMGKEKDNPPDLFRNFNISGWRPY